MHMTAEALEGIDSEIQKFKMQVSSRNGKQQGCEARMMRGEDDRAEDKGGRTSKRTLSGMVNTSHIGL